MASNFLSNFFTFFGKVYPTITVCESTDLSETRVSTIFVNAANEHVVITLPHPERIYGNVQVIALDNTNGIEVVPPCGVTILDTSNIQFNSTGDAVVFTSNDKDVLAAVSRYTSHLNY